MTAAIPVTRFGGKVFAYNANSIVVSKGTLDNGIKFNSGAKKSDRSCRNGVDTVCDSPQRFKLYSRDLHFHHIFDFEKRPKMTEVPQFYSVAHLPDSHASTWK